MQRLRFLGRQRVHGVLDDGPLIAGRIAVQHAFLTYVADVIPAPFCRQPLCNGRGQLARIAALEEIAGAMGDKVKIVKLNVDENPGVASKYGIMSIPTLMLFKNGEIASRQVGAAPKQKLQQWIQGSV